MNFKHIAFIVLYVVLVLVGVGVSFIPIFGPIPGAVLIIIGTIGLSSMWFQYVNYKAKFGKGNIGVVKHAPSITLIKSGDRYIFDDGVDVKIVFSSLEINDNDIYTLSDGISGVWEGKKLSKKEAKDFVVMMKNGPNLTLVGF